PDEEPDAVVYVTRHRFAALTRQDGTYVIDGVPPGRYRIVARHANWTHPVWASKPIQVEREVVVAPGQVAAADFVLNEGLAPALTANRITPGGRPRRRATRAPGERRAAGARGTSGCAVPARCKRDPGRRPKSCPS